MMLARRTAGWAPLPQREFWIVQHLIASHHGKLEFGATVAPMTPEAEVLHHADNASAKTASMAQAVADADNFQGDDLFSSGTLWQLDKRKAYRGRGDWGLESSTSRT